MNYKYYSMELLEEASTKDLTLPADNLPSESNVEDVALAEERGEIASHPLAADTTVRPVILNCKSTITILLVLYRISVCFG